MSHFSKVRVNVKSRSALIKGLRRMGFSKHQIEVSDQKMTLKGYQGDDREQRANVRIKGSGWGEDQNYVGGASNDLGFELLEDGTYAFHVSDYDQGKYGKNWQEKFTAQYEREMFKETAEAQGFFIESEVEDEVTGRIELIFSSPF